MPAYTQSATNPSLVQNYDQEQKIKKDPDAPTRRANESDDEFGERVRKWSVVANVLERL